MIKNKYTYDYIYIKTFVQYTQHIAGYCVFQIFWHCSCHFVNACQRHPMLR